MYLLILNIFVDFSPIKRTLQLSDDEDESLKKKKNVVESSVLE